MCDREEKAYKKSPFIPNYIGTNGPRYHPNYFTVVKSLRSIITSGYNAKAYYSRFGLVLKSPFHIAQLLVHTNHKLSEIASICTLLYHRIHINLLLTEPF